MTNTNTTEFSADQRITTIQGQAGRVVGRLYGDEYMVALDGERTVTDQQRHDIWPAAALRAA